MEDIGMIQARASPAKRMLVSMMSEAMYIGMEERVFNKGAERLRGDKI